MNLIGWILVTMFTGSLGRTQGTDISIAQENRSGFSFCAQHYSLGECGTAYSHP